MSSLFTPLSENIHSVLVCPLCKGRYTLYPLMGFLATLGLGILAQSTQREWLLWKKLMDNPLGMLAIIEILENEIPNVECELMKLIFNIGAL